MDDIWWCITIFMGDICWYKPSSVMGPMGRTIGFITLKNSGTPPFPGPCFAQMSCKSFLSFAHFCESIKQSKQDWISVCISIHLSIVYIFLGDRHLASPFRFVNMCLAGLPSIEVQAHVAGGFQGCLEAGWTGTPCNHQKQEWNLSPTCNFELWLMICNLIWSQTWWFMIGSETNFWLWGLWGLWGPSCAGWSVSTKPPKCYIVNCHHPLVELNGTNEPNCQRA